MLFGEFCIPDVQEIEPLSAQVAVDHDSQYNGTRISNSLQVKLDKFNTTIGQLQACFDWLKSNGKSHPEVMTYELEDKLNKVELEASAMHAYFYVYKNSYAQEYRDLLNRVLDSLVDINHLSVDIKLFVMESIADLDKSSNGPYSNLDEMLAHLDS